MKKYKRYQEPRLGPTAKKILLLLAGGLALGFSYTHKRQMRILKEIGKEWERIDRLALKRAIQQLYKSKLADMKENKDGTTTMVILTQKGKTLSLRYEIDEMKVPGMKKWDGKWRIVLFDVPEKYKKARDALALSLKRMEFFRLQKSVFVHPFDCKNEIEFVVEFFNLRPYVRFVMAEHIDNEFHIKNHFGLS